MHTCIIDCMRPLEEGTIQRVVNEEHSIRPRGGRRAPGAGPTRAIGTSVAARGGPGTQNHAQAYLGRQLRLLRESCGISREAAGRYIDGSEPKISRIELGRSRVKVADLEALLSLYRVIGTAERQAMTDLARRLDSSDQWWRDYGEVTTAEFRSYLVLESLAETVRTYELRFIPGLLQTRSYATALFRTHFTEEETARLVAVRVRRRQVLLEQRLPDKDRPSKPFLWAVIDESALHERIGSRDIMSEQIDFLIRATQRLNCRIQILPSGTGSLTGVGNSFSMLRMPATALPDVVHLEHLGGAHFHDDPRDIEPYRIAVERLGTTALEPAGTISELQKAKHRLSIF